MTAPNPHARLVSSPTLLALALYAFCAWRFDFLVDDAFITFRYGAHLAAGHGLVWNIGEQPPIEGFSNFLWVVLCAAFERLGVDPAVGTRVVSVASGALLIALLSRLVGARIAAGTTRLGAALFLAALPPLGVWATGGLETMTFTLAVFGVFERLAFEPARPHGLQAGAWAALAVLLRADGFVWVAFALAAALVLGWRERDVKLLRAITAAALCAALTAGAYLAFRYAYFGLLGPNTARIKVAFGTQYLTRGVQYVASLLLCIVSLPIALLGALLGARRRASRDASRLALPSLAFVGASFAYLIVLGGDWMMMYRMLVPALPFVVLAFACWLGALRSGLSRVSIGATCVLLSLLPSFDVHVVPRRWRELAHFRWGHSIPAEPGSEAAAEQKRARERIAALAQLPDDLAARAELARSRPRLEYCTEYAMWRKGVVDIENWIEIGRALALYTRPGESMALGNIGAFGYYAPELVVYDTQGLTNREPLLPLEPAARAMPGHDRKISLDYFDKYRPTYRDARIVDAAAPWTILPRAWVDVDAAGAVIGPNEAARAKFDFQLHPLDPARGFRVNGALLLIAHRR